MTISEIEAIAPVHPLTIEELPVTRVVNDVLQEIGCQDAKWGQQNHPDFYAAAPTIIERFRLHGIVDEVTARNACEWRAQTGEISWCDILIEEVAEAIGTENPEDLREELVQVAAVVHQWIACIDRRTARLEQAAWEAAQS